MVKRAIRGYGNKAQPLAMFIVGMTFVVIGVVQYPAFIFVGLFYIIIAIRGFRMLRGS